MNPIIDFYILEKANYQQMLFFTCQLAENAFQEQKPLYIYVGSEIEAERLDRLLWTYKEDSFLPHQIYREPINTTALIQIGDSQNPPHRECLLNLCPQIPSFYQQFDRLIEIVFPEPSVQQLARERYKHYRDNQYEINTHKINQHDLNRKNI